MAQTDTPGVAFLRWALPQLGFRWRGFRRVRGQVLKRVARRYQALGLSSFTDYQRYLEGDPAEWRELDPLCRVTISRFYRDRQVFDELRAEVVPALRSRASERGAEQLRVWSAGCASGEEPYTLALLAHHDRWEPYPQIVGTDADPYLLERARRARYARATLRELDERWVREDFRETPDGELELREEIRAMVEFGIADLRRDAPDGEFDLVLCRNLAFTYFDLDAQRRTLELIADRMVAGGALVVGGHEKVPHSDRLSPWRRCILRRE